MPRRTEAPPRRFLRIALPVAALLLAAVVIAAGLLREPIGRMVSRVRETKPMGVLIGVPESSPALAVQNVSAATPPPTTAVQPANATLPHANQPPANVATASNPSQVASPDVHQNQTANLQSQTAAPNASEAISPAAVTESSSSSAGETKSSSQPDVASQPYISGQSGSQGKRKTVSSASPRRVGSGHAQMVGITSDGRLIYRLPSGRTRVVAPDSDEGEFAPRRHRRILIDRDEVFAPRPRFAPDYFPDD